MKSKMASMALKHKVVWWLSRYDMLTMMNIYIDVSRVIKKKFHI